MIGFKSSLLILAAAAVIALAGCGASGGSAPGAGVPAGSAAPNAASNAAGGSPSPSPAGTAITDSAGVAKSFSKAPERVVILGSYPATMFKALGLDLLVVGIDDYTAQTTQWPPYIAGLPKVGSSQTPDVEKIASLRPDLVISVYLKSEIAAKLEAAGIPVLTIYGYKTELIPQEFRTLGKLFHEEELAEKNAAYIEQQWSRVKSAVSGLSDSDKPKVYWENSSGAYKSFARNTGADPLIVMAGGINITGNEPVANPEVSAEWLVKQNPDVIVKYGAPDVLGWNGGNAKKLKEIKDEIKHRPGFKEIEAVKNNRVYIISSNITSDPRGPVGLYQVAKWLHPDLFSDIDPVAVYKDLLETFYGEEFRGIWTYP